MHSQAVTGEREPSPPLTALPPWQQIDELLAGSFTQEDEAAILEELDAITQVAAPQPSPVCAHSPRPTRAAPRLSSVPSQLLARQAAGGQGCVPSLAT